MRLENTWLFCLPQGRLEVHTLEDAEQITCNSSLSGGPVRSWGWRCDARPEQGSHWVPDKGKYRRRHGYHSSSNTQLLARCYNSDTDSVCHQATISSTIKSQT
ncbi:Ankyrin-1 [Fusarium oxysporum f. sp. albedinis]|nr:Ankyrin-1 [Fusarium oxysporum f. sp. albedinis]